MARVASLLLTVIVAAAASLLLLLAPSAAELTRVEHPPKNEGSLAILAVGDWGRRGQFNQTLVAQQVAENGHHAAFSISVYNFKNHITTHTWGDPLGYGYC